MRASLSEAKPAISPSISATMVRPAPSLPAKPLSSSAQAAQAANYPFCTIEPNTGMVTVPDARLWVLKDIAKTSVVIPTRIELVDIAGLGKGAAAGEGKPPMQWG